MAGGGWTLPMGSSYWKMSHAFLSTDWIYNFDGSELKINQTGVYISSLYAEYGVHKKVTIMAYIPFLYRSTFGQVTLQPSGQVLNTDIYTAVGDIDLTTKFSVISNGPIVISAALTLGIPIGSTNGGVSGLLQTGDGEFNQKLQLDASHSFYPIPIWISCKIGINNRNKGFSDEYDYGLEIGASIKDRMNFITKLDARESFMNGFRNELQASNFSNDIEFINLTIECNIKLFADLWLSMGVSRPFRGRKTLIANTYIIGMIWDLSQTK